MTGVSIEIAMVEFYEGIQEDPWHENTYENVLMFTPEFKQWMRENIGNENWMFEKVTEPLLHHWKAYDRAKEGIPTRLLFWFADKRDAAYAKLRWHRV